MSQRLKDIIISLVAVVWSINVTAPMFIKDFKSSAEVNAAFMAIVGVYFTTRNNDKKKDEDAK